MSMVYLSSPSSLPRLAVIFPGGLFLHPFKFIHYRPRFICGSSKEKEPGLTDRILDYIEGGPKLRKWYGMSDALPKDGLKDEDDKSTGIGDVQDAVLVTNGESEIGQMVILSLIVKRVRVKALVKDKKASIDAFGTYVEALTGDARNLSFLSKALRGVRAVVCPANDGFFSDAGQIKGVQHVVLLTQLDAYRSVGLFQAIINSKFRKLAERDEKVVITSGIPYTIVKAGLLQDMPGGKHGFCFDEGVASKGSLSKEDAARVCVEALDVVPPKGLIFEVVNGDERVEDWKEWFNSKIRDAEELA